jgi:outer membrane protein assembly factor BamB
LWRFDYPFKVSTAASPIVWQDIVYCSAAYGVGAGACRVSKDGAGFKATELWRQEGKLMNHWSTPVCKDGHLYGLYGHGKDDSGPLKCIEIATGKELWSQPGFGAGGATVLVDGNVLVQSSRGPLVLVEATPGGYHELARAQFFGGQCWTMPVVSNGRIYARNTKEGVCINVSPQTARK